MDIPVYMSEQIFKGGTPCRETGAAAPDRLRGAHDAAPAVPLKGGQTAGVS